MPTRNAGAKGNSNDHSLRLTVSSLYDPARSAQVAMFRVVIGTMASSALFFSATQSLPHSLVARESHQQLVFHSPWWSGPLGLLGLLLALAFSLLALRDGVNFFTSGIHANDRSAWNEPSPLNPLVGIFLAPFGLFCFCFWILAGGLCLGACFTYRLEVDDHGLTESRLAGWRQERIDVPFADMAACERRLVDGGEGYFTVFCIVRKSGRVQRLPINQATFDRLAVRVEQSGVPVKGISSRDPPSRSPKPSR